MTASARAPHSARPAVLERFLALRVSLGREALAYVGLFAAAFGLRFWDLGSRALHHDESIHAQWAWKLLQGDYRHDPIFHGPFYYHAQAFVFLIFGASDYTSRVSAAAFGLGLVALPLLLRRRLGAVGTMAAVTLLAFSPTVVYYSRFFREDIYMAFFTLAMVAAMWRYIESGRDRWLIMFALAFTGSVTTKEATFLTTAVFLVFLSAHLAADLVREYHSEREIDDPVGRFFLTACLTPFAWAVAALWPFLGPLKRAARWERLPRGGDVLVVLGTLVLPLLTAFLKPPIEGLGLVNKGELVCRGVIPQRDAIVLGGLFLITGSAAAFVGLQWRARTWAIAAGASALIYLTLMTSLWTNLDGLCTGPWGSLDYWLTQQDYARGDQPWFYYNMLMPAYEFLPLGIAVAGLWWSLVRGNAFSRFLVVWMVGVWLALSMAGEKMPWLNTHIALPACLLAAWTVNRAWQAWDPRPPLRKVIAVLLGVAALSAGAVIAAVFFPGDGVVVDVARGLLVSAAVAVAVYAARPFGRRAAATFAIAAFAGAMAFFSLRTMVTASFVRGDTPRDLIVYTQSSPDIPVLRSQIDDLARATGLGYDLPIAVDTADSFAWPWAWYLRDYKRVSYVDFTAGPPQGDFSVMLVNQSNIGRVNDTLAQSSAPRFAGPTRYPHRWWFDEVYKAALPTGPLDPETWRTIGEGIAGGWFGTWYDYWRDHDPGRPNGSVDAYAYFPANFDRAKGALSARPLEPPKPSVDAGGRPMFGGAGSFPGQFFNPVDIEQDAAGNLYVIDSATHRLQKFDPLGNFLDAIDIRADAKDPNEASQPWGLAIGPHGEVVVADTFGWRVRVFDSNLKPLLTFGRTPDVGKPPGDFDLYGPRDAAVDKQGNIWVTDTGNARIMVYSLAGTFVRQIGSRGSGPGQFDEPVGIAIAADGTVFVADMYNKRVVMLDSAGAPAGSFPVSGWGGQEVTDKPYLRPLRDGRVAVSLPGLNEVRIYQRNGTLVATIKPSDDLLLRPYGIVEIADGRLWIVDGGNARVRLFSIP
jgi:uncharacterized protein (TIGR03663 family)